MECQNVESEGVEIGMGVSVLMVRVAGVRLLRVSELRV